MNGVKSLLIALGSLFLSILFCFPTIVFFLGAVVTMYSQWFSILFCLIFAWYSGKFVEYIYKGYTEEDDEH